MTQTNEHDDAHTSRDVCMYDVLFDRNITLHDALHEFYVHDDNAHDAFTLTIAYDDDDFIIDVRATRDAYALNASTSLTRYATCNASHVVAIYNVARACRTYVIDIDNACRAMCDNANDALRAIARAHDD